MNLPDKVFGIETSKAYKDYLERAKNSGNGDEKEPPQPLNIRADINSKDYLQVPGVNGLYGNPFVISKFEVLGTNGKNYEDTHRLVFQSQTGLYISTPRIFMPHFKNVVEAYNNNQSILDAAGAPISRKEHEEIYSHLTTNFGDIYQTGNPGAWTWLNARFIPGKGFNNLDLETIVGINADGSFKAKKEPLMPCLNENAYAELKFNPQGSPIEKAANQKYEQGKNMRFYPPAENSVAWFSADSDRAGFDCDRDPQDSNPALGVFLCAEGTRADFGDKE